jgi:exonuclease III
LNKKYEVQYVESDGIGRRIIVVLEDESSKFIVANSYLPNDHRLSINNVEALYTKILDVKSKYNDHIIISGGDFNVCLNVHDQLNRKISIQESELAKSIIENNKLLGLKDSFRAVHPKNGSTWKRAMTYSRLDYVFISKEIVPNIINANVDWAFETSDHAAFKLK